MSVEEFIIAVYCLVDDIMNELLNSKSLRQRGFNPALTDSEMIAMELVAEFQGIDTDKGAWEYFCNHWRALFPNIGSRANFAKHAANLWNMKQQIQKVLAGRMGHLPIYCIFQMVFLYPFVISEERILVKYLQVRLLMVIVHPRGKPIMALKAMY